MENFDFRFYLSLFWRKFPYFLVTALLISAVGLTLARMLPPVYRATSTLLVEGQQIPDDLAQSTVPVSAIEQIQIIQQRLMTRANLLDMAERFGIYDGRPEMTADEKVANMRSRITFNTNQPLRGGRTIEGATTIHVAFNAPTAKLSADVTNEITTLILQENVKLRTDRATDTLDFFEQEVSRLSGELDKNAAAITAFKNENRNALPDSAEFRRNEQTLNQERLLQLEREQSTVRDTRDRMVAIYEQTGRVLSDRAQSREEQELGDLRRQLDQARSVYSETSPNVTILKNRIAALEPVVEEQLALLSPGSGLSEYDMQLQEFDGRLEFISAEKTRIEARLAELEKSLHATPANEMTLATLQRRQGNLRSQYDAAVARSSDAAVGERIEVLAKGERFSLVERATPPEKPVSPNRLLIGGGSILAGLGAGLSLIGLMELLNRTIRRPVELTSRLGIQPMVTVPYMEPGRKARSRAAALLLPAAGAAAALAALHGAGMPLS